MNEDPDLVYKTIFVVIRNWGEKETKQNFPVIGDWLSKIQKLQQMSYDQGIVMRLCN